VTATIPTFSNTNSIVVTTTAVIELAVIAAVVVRESNSMKNYFLYWYFAG
jgi:hypothetical protein